MEKENLSTAMEEAGPDVCVFDPPPSGSPPTEPMSEPNLIPAMAAYNGIVSAAAAEAVAVSYDELVKLYDDMESASDIQAWWLANVAIQWLIETSQGNEEEIFRSQTQVIDLTHEDTFMIGAIRKEIDGTGYSIQMDDDGYRIANQPFSWRKMLADPRWRDVLLKDIDGEGQGVMKLTFEWFGEPNDGEREIPRVAWKTFTIRSLPLWAFVVERTDGKRIRFRPTWLTWADGEPIGITFEEHFNWREVHFSGLRALEGAHTVPNRECLFRRGSQRGDGRSPR